MGSKKNNFLLFSGHRLGQKVQNLINFQVKSLPSLSGAELEKKFLFDLEQNSGRNRRKENRVFWFFRFFYGFFRFFFENLTSDSE